MTPYNDDLLTRNRRAVWDFFRDNPCHNRTDCSEATGIGRKTVNKHATAIRDGWRPPVTPERMASCPLKGCGLADG